MKAAMCKSFDGPDGIEVSEVEDPVPGEGQVLVSVGACAVTFPDLLMTRDMYQYKPGLPFIPGTEIAGTVEALGPGVSGVEIGERVVATTMTGGMAERAVVNALGLVRLPPSMEFASAAGIMYAYGTSHHALKDRAKLAPGETLLVLGAAGGVGSTAVEIGRLMGARVIAAASSEEKLAMCRQIGADETINYSSEDLKIRVRELTDGVGADVVYDPVGGPYAEPALRSTAWGGRYLVIGFAAGEIPRIPLNLALLRGCSIVGVFWGSFVGRQPEAHHANMRELEAWWAEGKLSPHVSHRYPLEQAADALRDMGERKVVGKVAVTP